MGKIRDEFWEEALPFIKNRVKEYFSPVVWLWDNLRRKLNDK